MTVYVLRGGQLVDKRTNEPAQVGFTGDFPCPRLSRFDAFDSPVTGQPITSWRQREKDLSTHDCYDVRDLSPNHKFKRGRAAQLEEVRANGRREPK